ncbi:hypothetical protein LTR36_007116 [Oleoguttula mirabilis]|uniref:Uncharacterized protein n=1 Tax=Oleoguttula mirabilis TaxID=1507867 RepID=A0AAV9JB06_9PEZI|nr:hypothetical protein LTR36_007116 [Oleoguttula mirabilis]
MPTFEQNSYGALDYTFGAVAHYHGKADGMRESLRSQSSNGTAPPTPPKDIRYSPGAATAARTAGIRSGGQDSAYPTITTQRKPVATANLPAAQQPQPTIKRKPVGERPTPITIPSTPTVQQQQGILSPNGELRTIFRDASGKIDLTTIKTVPVARWTPPAFPSVQAQPRPSSRGSFLSFGRSDRADTSDSSTGRRPGSRRGSITDLFKSAGRRLSDAFKDKATIVKMDPEEREDWIESRREEKKRSASQRSNERESTHREKPRDRPSHQKDALVRKNMHNAELAHNLVDTNSNYDVMLAQSESNAGINRAHRKSYNIACDIAASRGEPRPKSPAELPVADLSLDPAERRLARQSTGPKHIDELASEGRISPPHFTTGEKIAIALSKTTDTLKTRGRSNTAESAMSFGMTDLAPPEMMHVCSRCNRPPEDFLHSSGFCNACHIYLREQKVKMAKMGK